MHAGGDDDLAGLLLADFRHLPVVAQDRSAGFLLELIVQHLQQPPRRLGVVQAAKLVERLPLHVQELGEVLLALVDVLDLLSELALRGLDHLLLLAELLGLFFEGVLPFVQQPFAFVELAADFAELFLALFLLLEDHLLKLQLALAAAVVRVLSGLGNDRGRFAHGVLAAQPVEQFDENERHDRADAGGDNGYYNIDLSWRHDNRPSSYWT